ncbi:hypothetical protein ASPVEDRAFT_83453 [Aspergillus versicolor CBS 583.65]|uniref:Uncharacterized protein n=1 Tax=Aspergillus versicolor CBS 583.65 TaxID=1036611 RepID=A0A1L9PKB0_ASPVE|nr:uncharacterized protein ASPVEDRAFT_83453 [Aspergillus versicolor CBS 583.65]OJJ01931.1 hypothetical protein ASPVEDRAFT_83453 [Aspergillus versicolor CBS 583.65]
MTEIEPMMLLGPPSLSSEQSAPVAGHGSVTKEHIGGPEIHPKKERRNPQQQQPSDTRNESKGGDAKERCGGEGGRKLATGGEDSGSDSDDQGSSKSEEYGKEHRVSMAGMKIFGRQKPKGSVHPTGATREEECDGTSKTSASATKRFVEQANRLMSYPGRLLKVRRGNKAEGSAASQDKGPGPG